MVFGGVYWQGAAAKRRRTELACPALTPMVCGAVPTGFAVTITCSHGVQRIGLRCRRHLESSTLFAIE